jgi:hypothetical protein
MTNDSVIEQPMTAPTPEQLRALAGLLSAQGDVWDRNGLPSKLNRSSAAALRAAANQIENQQDWLDHSHPVDLDADAKQMIDSAGEEVARLRAVLEDAPHADSCAARLSSHAARPWPCNCWKAGAL